MSADIMAAELKLRPYQEAGVQWLCDGHPYKLLADDMGLGKTPQAIAAMNRLQVRTALIICPATVKIMWARRISQWGSGNIYIAKKGDAIIPAWADIIIVNYDLTIRPKMHGQLVARGEAGGYDLVLFDESRALKNMKAKRTLRCLGKKAFTKNARRIWLLDGTPVPNRPVELFPVLFTLAPEVIRPYDTYTAFGEYFCKGKRDVFGWDMSGHSHIGELSERLRASDFFLRRTKEEVMDDLPEKVETFIEVDADITCDTTTTPIATVRRELGLAKIPSAARYIADAVGEVGKVVAFAHHRDVIEGLKAGLEALNPVILYGGMSDEHKQVSIDRFINDPLCGVIIAQTLAGGSGVDGLQEVSSNIIFVEQDWSPGVMDQAVDRIRRIGQQAATVFIHYLMVAGSIDEPMTDVLDRKRAVVTRLMQPSGGIESFDIVDVIDERNENPMTIEVELKRIADSLEALVVSASIQVEPQTVAPGKPKKGAPKAGVETEAAAQAAPAAGPTQDDALAAISTFLAGTEGDACEALKHIIREKILKPKYNVPAFKELPPAQYAAFMVDLAQGPAAYRTAAPTLDDV